MSSVPDLQPVQDKNGQLPPHTTANNFTSLLIPDSLVSTLRAMEINQPTPIQAATIALAIEGKDIMASAQTGTGKTLAYVLPLLARLLASNDGNALILAPTRELAVQVRDTIYKLLGKKPLCHMALLIGGESMGKQFAQLRNRPRIIVGTPGRIYDHLNRGNLNLKQVNYLVVDESDRMLDMGFSVQLDKISAYLPKERQTLMFSATLPPSILKLSQKYLRDPVRVCVDSPTKAAPKIKQEVISTSAGEKFTSLLTELTKRDGSVIIFVKTKRGADQLADKLRQRDLSADSIHGDLKQRQRDRAILRFRNNTTRIMVATDIAARGLDIPHIRHVINYDLPQCPEDYIHRIGRTARAGQEGNALCLICPADQDKWKAINRLMNPTAPNTPANNSKNPHQKRFSNSRGTSRRPGRGDSNTSRGDSNKGRGDSNTGRGDSNKGRGDSNKGNFGPSFKKRSFKNNSRTMGKKSRG